MYEAGGYAKKIGTALYKHYSIEEARKIAEEINKPSLVTWLIKSSNLLMLLVLFMVILLFCVWLIAFYENQYCIPWWLFSGYPLAGFLAPN